ncbi:hypothetical protein PAXRUDRAFT_803416 [Paxillus rubicundulus Ve08.2h10]|uniref:Uncharacterized protein n=1 Tax=Paxillus rubicundulus Ve08.2h10 TaxID=930991 RepID=A0A0D0DU67_9AGAM|nr:hypothetical protein PAXRUDRAFT_803416 [Paxillus rubicundulus Ve08.2h10]
MPTTTTKAPSSLSTIGGSGSQHHFNNTSLTPSFAREWKWRKSMITTLCLWAASQPDVWNITKQQISDALKEILPVVYPELPQVNQDISPLSAPIPGHQHLCEWWHSVGSAAITLFTSFFVQSSDDDI